MNPATQKPNNQATPTKGWITKSYISYKGKKLGPYYARTWFEHGKRRKEYIKKQDLARIRAQCEAHREMKIRGRQLASQLATTLGNLNWLERMAKRLDMGAIRPEDHAFVEQIKRHGITTPGRTMLKSRPTPRTWAEFAAQPFTAAPSGHLRFTTYRGIEIPDKPEGCHRDDLRPKNFMDHFFQNPKATFWEDSFTDAEHIAKAIFATETTEGETVDQKWKRWRESMAKKPKPRPLPLLTPPDWVDKKEITAAVHDVIELTKRSSAAKSADLAAVVLAKEEPLVREEEQSVALPSQPSTRGSSFVRTIPDERESATSGTTVSPKHSPPRTPPPPRTPREIRKTSNERSFTEQLRRFQEDRE